MTVIPLQRRDADIAAEQMAEFEARSIAANAGTIKNNGRAKRRDWGRQRGVLAEHTVVSLRPGSNGSGMSLAI